MTRHLRKRIVWTSLLLTGVDSLFFGFTSPSKVPSALLGVGFVLIVATLYYLLRVARALLSVYYPSLARYNHAVGAVTAVGAIVLALQSIGQLTVRDFILFPLAGAAVYAYLGYLRKQPQT